MPTEVIALNYDVLDSDDNVIYYDVIRSTFPETTAYVDAIDELLELAYERESGRIGWSDSWSIEGSP